MGNLLIVALWDQLGDTVAGLDLVARLLDSRGRVLPMAGEPLEIEADVVGADPDRPDDVSVVCGQHRVASTRGRVSSIRLRPAHPQPCPEALAAIDDADWVLLGPGSWFTSVLPHVLVPDVRDALVRTRDVYKRQPLGHPQVPQRTGGRGAAYQGCLVPDHPRKPWRTPDGHSTQSSLDPAAVSYTHLDVYKRQVHTAIRG